MDRENIIAEHLKPGDTITHHGCMGCIKEHLYTGKDGNWLCGIPTADTMRIERWDGDPADHATNDISPRNITHINRTPVESVPFLAESWRKSHD